MIALQITDDTIAKLDLPVENLLDDYWQASPPGEHITRAKNVAESYGVLVGWQLAIQPRTEVLKWKNCARKTVYQFTMTMQTIGADLGLQPNNLTLLKLMKKHDRPEELEYEYGMGYDYFWQICAHPESFFLGHNWSPEKLQILKDWLAGLGLKLGMTAREVFRGIEPAKGPRDLTADELKMLATGVGRAGLSPAAEAWCRALTFSLTMWEVFLILKVVRDCKHRAELEQWFADRNLLDIQPSSAEITMIFMGDPPPR